MKDSNRRRGRCGRWGGCCWCGQAFVNPPWKWTAAAEVVPRTETNVITPPVAPRNTQEEVPNACYREQSCVCVLLLVRPKVTFRLFAAIPFRRHRSCTAVGGWA